MGRLAGTTLHVELDGTPMDAKLTNCIVSALVRQTLSAPALAEIVLAEVPKEKHADLSLGAAIRLLTEGGVALFEGDIVTVEHQRDRGHGHVVRLRALDKLHRLRKRQRARAVPNASATDLAREAAREIDVAFAASAPAPARELIVQHDQSDLELLTAVALDAGSYVTLDETGLRLVSLAGDGDILELRLGRELVSVSTTSSTEPLRSGATTDAWNVVSMAVLSESAAQAQQGEPISSAGVSGGPGERHYFNRVASSAEDARAFAQFDLDHAAARALIADAVADGDPAIKPGRIVAIEDVGGTSLGRFTVTGAIHRFDPTGAYTTEFSSAPPERAVRAGAPILTLGVVVDLSDPQSWSRVRVKLPVFGDVDSTWMPVLIPGAGPNKGMAILPEVNDRVLVAFPNGDLAQGIVLGGLYGEQTSPGLSAGGMRPFALRTNNGQLFLLDAERGLIRVETSGGDHLELGPNGAHLHATQDLILEAPGKTIKIRAKSVEFEQK